MRGFGFALGPGFMARASARRLAMIVAVGALSATQTGESDRLAAAL